MATLIGKVGMVMKGDWSSSATYEALDAVSYNNGLYVAKQAVPANTLPTNTTYWQNAIDPNGLTKYNYYTTGGTAGSVSFPVIERRFYYVAAFRRSGTTDEKATDGFGILIEYNGVLIWVKKERMSGITAATYDIATGTVTLTLSDYMTICVTTM